jgi:hypothetical protein
MTRHPVLLLAAHCRFVQEAVRMRVPDWRMIELQLNSAAAAVGWPAPWTSSEPLGQSWPIQNRGFA